MTATWICRAEPEHINHGFHRLMIMTVAKPECIPEQPQHSPTAGQKLQITQSAGVNQGSILRTDSRFAPSQWEMALLCNDVSHWLGASLESSLYVELITAYFHWPGWCADEDRYHIGSETTTRVLPVSHRCATPSLVYSEESMSKEITQSTHGKST